MERPFEFVVCYPSNSRAIVFCILQTLSDEVIINPVSMPISGVLDWITLVEAKWALDEINVRRSTRDTLLSPRQSLKKIEVISACGLGPS